MPDEVQDLLQSTGISIDYKLIIIGILFGVVGLLAWRHGRKGSSLRHMLLGVALMVYPYFVPNFWWSLAVGAVLTLFLF